MALPPPRAPFADWAVQVSDPRFGYAWLAEPFAFVSQTTIERADIPFSESLHDLIDHVLVVEAERVAAQGGLLFLHDFRSIRGYDRDAREHFFSRMKRRKVGYARRSIVVVGDTPLMKMAVQGANLLNALRGGSAVELTTNALAAVRDHGIARPGATPAAMADDVSRSP